MFLLFIWLEPVRNTGLFEKMFRFFFGKSLFNTSGLWIQRNRGPFFFSQRKHFPWQFWHRIRSGIYLKIGICSCFLFGSHFLVSEYVSLSMQFSSNCMLGAYIARPATLSPHAVTFIDSLLDTTCLVGLHCTMEAHLFLHFRSWEHLNYTHITDCKL